MTIDDLVDELAKPIMVLRFAKGDPRKGSGAAKRAQNARLEIDRIVHKYCEKKDLTRFGVH